ncbi:HI1506-related protein [Pseudomonas veronii]|uniref:Mu-like prophage FluMu N-terminal domain-containing protein n=1 Tax=Pseudomonas veronii TaxID=76761 RepID=A0A5M8ELJ6_PSEVE|nr:HI1506-related protein [Pseudomonas veronii]KAA6172714.1 hypothetical protein F3K53_24440 [Pseudomonas veronii]KAA6174321.1 hypothetical protein F3K54_17350 [Pseudomonas veronii]
MTIIITSKRDGFRRCGVAHSSTVARYPDDFFSEAQLRALSKEPQLILAYEEDEFDQVQDRRDESFQEVDVSKAPGTTQNHQSQTLEANVTALGVGVVLPVAPVAGDLDSLWEDALLEDRAREVAKAQAASDVELESLWDNALQEDQAREDAKAQASKPPVKPGKPKATKVEGEGK